MGMDPPPGREPTTGPRRSSRRAADPIMRRQSSRLLLAASSTLTGTALLPPDHREAAEATERRPDTPAPQSGLLRRNTSTVRRQQVQERMMRVLWARFKVLIVLLLIILFAGLLSFAILLFWNVKALMFHFSEPCDQPLNYYLITVLGVGQISRPVAGSNRIGQSQRVAWILQFMASLPGYIVIGWGVYMVNKCTTCQTTNPELYYSTKYYIYFQIGIVLLLSLVVTVGFSGAFAFFSMLKDRSKVGCEKAVRQLPRVPWNSPELVDEEDDSIIGECPICTDSFSLEGSPSEDSCERAIVRTPCSHHFHEDCLAKWCRNHTDCPLCRAQIGELDAA